VPNTGSKRYSDYYRMIEGISERLLAARLKELTNYDLLERAVTPTTPVQVTYTLSVRGRELLVSLAPLIKWGQKWDLKGSD
jgi:DNA-binding HxlR family transcriptional regulator